MLRWWTEPPRIAVLTLGWAAIILFLSALPGRDLPQVDLLHADKLAHLLVYLILQVLIALWLVHVCADTAILTSVVLATLYGIAMEAMQHLFFEERFFDWYDALANFLGALLGIVIFKLIR
ncbi:MAG: VanZ family protein [Flavobacteriales bacterium]|nr:VanZ family protein [Flavobacteriales bacterium]